jgi:hypothetical protein
MSDFIEIKDVSGAPRKIAVDEIAGILAQRVKVQFGADGSATDASSANPLPIHDAANLTVLEAIATALGSTIKVGDGSGALTIDGTVILAAGSAAIGQTDPRGNKAHDEADAGNPVKVGTRARTALIAAVSQDDRSDAMADKFGRLLETVAPLDQRVAGTTNFTNNTVADVIAAPGANTAIVVTAVKVVNGHATVGTKVEILNDATKVDLGYAAAAGGGWFIADPHGLFVCTTNKAARAKPLVTGSDIDVTMYGYKIPA